MPFPSKENQFPKGKAGPGRPKGVRNRSTIAKRVLSTAISIDAVSEKKREQLRGLLVGLGIKEEEITAEILITIAQVIQGMKGDSRSYTAIMDSAYGKPLQTIENTTPEPDKYDLSKLTEDELNEYRNLEVRINELLSKCAITAESGEQDCG